MIACLAIPGFELRVALRRRPRLTVLPAALAPAEGTEPLLGPVTAAAEAAGARPGMRLGEALALCPSLVLVEADPQGVEREWEEILRRLEDAGIAVSPAEPGTAFFETRGVERLYGGIEPALKRALAAVGPLWDARIGAAERKFAALAAANVAGPGQLLVVSDERTREFLAPLPLDLLPLREEQQQELKELGVRRLGELAGLPGGAVAERLGPRGRRAPSELVERLEFPEAVGNEVTLRRAFNVLLDRLLTRPEREQRFARKVAIAARVVGGASWRRTLTLREPTIERDRLRAALAPKLAELPAPVLELRLELVELTESTGQQLELVQAAGAELDSRLSQGLRQVRSSTGPGSVNTVVEVAPWSRIPEARALFVPRDD